MFQHGQSCEALSFRDVSVVVTLFLRELLSLATISAFPQSTPLWHSTVCRARPPCSSPIHFSADRVFTLRRSSFVSLTLSTCSFTLVWKNAPCFLYIHSILAGTRNLIHNAFLLFTKRLLTCAFNLFNLSSRLESNSKRVSVSSSPGLLRQPFQIRYGHGLHDFPVLPALFCLSVEGLVP